MSLTLRNIKGTPLTYTEMDNNLTYLEGLGATGSIVVSDINISGNLVVGGTSSLNDVVIASGKKITGATDNLTFEVVDGDLKSGLELDPVENVNGTRFYTEDTNAEQSSQLYLGPQSTNLQSFDSNFSVYNSIISTSFIPGFFGGNDSTSFSLEANNLAGSNIASITGIVDLVTDESTIIMSADIIQLINLPTYADNAAAVSDSYPTDGVYKTSTGELRIVV